MIQLTLTLKMTTAQSLSTTEQEHSCSGLRSPDDHTQLTYEKTPGFKPFTKWSKVLKTKSITKLDHSYLNSLDAIAQLWRNQYNLNFTCTYCRLSWPLGQRKTQGGWVELSLNLVLVWLAFAIGHFRVPKTLTFKMRLGAQPFLWKLVLFAWEWKMISISKAEHLPSFWNRGPGNSEMAYCTNTVAHAILLKAWPDYRRRARREKQ